ncbi:hypothetical protein PS15m_006900 [Mucor circinelloides]
MKAFKKFRNKSIEEAEKGSELNSLRILSLSHIFPVHKINSEKSIVRHLKSEEKSAVEDLAKELEPKLPRAPAQAILYCKDLIDGVEVEGGEEEEEQDMMKTIKYLSRAIISNKAKISCSSEASFSEKYIMPAIRRVILDKSSDSIIYAIIDKADKYKKKPDIMIGTEFKKKDYYFFFVEIKRPSTQSKYQAEDDYVKLLKEMKGSIDNQLLLGIENPSSLGLLVEGFTCTLFCTVLLTDGVYCPIAVKRFHLVGEIYEMINLPSIVEVLTFVKIELDKFAEEVVKKRKRGERKKMMDRVFPSFKTHFLNK